MKVFESIYLILEDKGPSGIEDICTEVNAMLSYQDSPLLPAHIASILNRRKDLFVNHQGKISILPDKQPIFLVATLDGDHGICYQVNVNFAKKRFTFFEWRNNPAHENNSQFLPKQPGSMLDFKNELLNLKVWEWFPIYGGTEGITLGETNWSVKLVTKGKTYQFEGTDCYPAEWRSFTKAIEKLTGSHFSARSAQ